MNYILSALFILLSTGAHGFIDRMLYGEWSAKSGDNFTRAVNLLGIFFSLLLYWWGAQGQRRVCVNRTLPLAAAGLLLTSVLWSLDPSTTITRGVAYLFMVVGAIGLVELLDTDDVMRLSASISGFLAATSLLLLFVRPDTVMVGDDFRGLFSQKNVLGEAMVVGVLTGLHVIRIGGRRRFYYVSITAVCALAVAFSKSMTSLLTIVAFFALHVIGTLYVKGGVRRIMSIFLTIVTVTTFTFVVTNPDFIFELLDKDPTLTGRTDLWPYVIDSIYERPVLGWGYVGFWTPSNPRAVEISSLMGWGSYVAEAHNGFLQILLYIGVVGTVYFLFLWMRNLVTAVKCLNGLTPEIGVSALLVLVGILLIGISEHVLLAVDGLTLQFFLLGFMCEKELWLARHARRDVIFRSAELHVGQFGTPQQENAV
jgi:exopolysaccharide production protein ExoQ